MTETERLQKEVKALIKKNAHLKRVLARQRSLIEKQRKLLSVDGQMYINVQKGRADKRRKNRG